LEKYKYFLGTIFSISVLIVSLWVSILIPTYDKGFYFRQYEKNDVHATIRISEEDLQKVTMQIIRYLQLKTDQLNLEVEIDSEMRLFYNERELLHMEDVQDLFWFFGILSGICAVIAVLIFLALRSLPDFSLVIAKCVRNTFVFFILIAVSLIILISTDFDKYFTIFHEIFFSNDLWILDPATDLLINIVPLPFFISISIYVAVVFVIFSTVIVLSTSLLLYKRKEV